ncbi:hypothetical protein D3C77_411600 [compost metagenome]
MKKLLAWIPLIFSIIIIAYFTIPWLLIFIGGQLEPNPPKPKITYAEFPVRLEYEVNGERKVAQDTVICEYEGVGWNEGSGKYRKWKQRLASGNDDFLLLKVDDSTRIYFYPESAQYYMNDLQEYDGVSRLFPNAMIQQKQGETDDFSRIRADELLKTYKIKLIKWEDSPPIKNSFIDEE